MREIHYPTENGSLHLRVWSCLQKKDAHLMDVLIKSSKVECVSGMGQHGQRRNAAVKDAQILSGTEECASCMEQRSGFVGWKVV